MLFHLALTGAGADQAAVFKRGKGLVNLIRVAAFRV
jgi:hypothetical protein